MRNDLIFKKSKIIIFFAILSILLSSHAVAVYMGGQIINTPMIQATTPILPMQMNNMVLSPVIGQIGGPNIINGINGITTSGPGMSGFGIPAIQTPMIGLPGTNNIMGIGLIESNIISLGSGPMLNPGIGPTTNPGSGPMFGLSPTPLTNSGMGPLAGPYPAPMIKPGIGPAPMMNPGMGPMVGLYPVPMINPVMGPAPMMSPVMGPMFGLGPGPMLNPSMGPMIGFGPAPTMNPGMFIPVNTLMPYSQNPYFNNLSPIYYSTNLPGKNTSINSPSNNPQTLSNTPHKGNQRFVYLGDTIVGIRPDGKPNIVKNYLDTLTGKRLRGHSHGQGIFLPKPAPDYEWWYGCTPTSAGMLIGYYDVWGYNGNTYDLVLGGLADLNSFGLDSLYPVGPTLLCNKAIASAGHIADFWVSYESTGDPLASGRTIPLEFDCLADFMGTSQDNLTSLGEGNSDGMTSTIYNVDGSKLTIPGTIAYMNYGLYPGLMKSFYMMEICIYWKV